MRLDKNSIIWVTTIDILHGYVYWLWNGYVWVSLDICLEYLFWINHQNNIQISEKISNYI